MKKYVVMSGNKTLGIYDTYEEALKVATYLQEKGEVALNIFIDDGENRTALNDDGKLPS